MFGCEVIVLALIVCGFYYFINGIDKFFGNYRKITKNILRNDLTNLLSFVR